VLDLVTAIVKPHRVAAVKDALIGAGVKGLTVSEAKGFGRQGGHTETYRGTEYRIDLVPKVKVDVLCLPEVSGHVAAAIAEAGRTGRIGDGKIWITPVEQVIRIRTGELGGDAI
jgi:nitrogen regulatory protein P-II 1